MVVYFRHVSVNISPNFIYLIIENYLYYLDYTYKLLKIKLINLGCLKLLFLLAALWLLVCGDLFPVLSVRLPMMLLLLLVLNRFISCLDRSDLLLIEKLMNLVCLELLLLAPLLPVAPGCSFCLVPRSSVCVCCTCALVVYFVAVCCACAWVVRSVRICCGCV